MAAGLPFRGDFSPSGASYPLRREKKASTKDTSRAVRALDTGSLRPDAPRYHDQPSDWGTASDKPGGNRRYSNAVHIET